MEYNYIENDSDRGEGFKIFNELYEINGSRRLILLLAGAILFISLLGIIFGVDIVGDNYFVFMISLYAVWYFSIRYYRTRKYFMKKEKIEYSIDIEKQEIRLDNYPYRLNSYVYSDKYLLIAYERNYLSLSYISIEQARVDKDFLESVFANMAREKPLTWKEYLVIVVAVTIIIEIFDYFL